MSVGSTASCPTRNLPQGIQLANDILNIQEVMEHGPALRPRRINAWWDEEQEEEEEDAEDG